jgi:hypothetical protein
MDRPRGGEPERLGEILKRVMADLEKQYSRGGCPPDRKREPVPPGPPDPWTGGERIGRLDKTASAANRKRLAKES